jgi:hypothetical protein
MKRLLLLFLLSTLVGCINPARGFCEAAAECDDLEARFPFGLDVVGEDNDSVDVCTVEQTGNLRALRANEERVCFELADAQERYMACVAEVYYRDPRDACDGLVRFNNNPCDDELDDFFDALRDADDDCSPNER